ncbi:concanavalin A-like lectin/glucanase domain-containing protein [Gigaspora rosea]|uniref:Concanavalin A-like lectin/glucanase domain-containing protein n=1 Tax=Gigaspora rosea TaxID=44941 RepID=A0A397UJB8_9GLOM|nr:concanavalin A-like lectin/glucanase domain-containing protein [Gigaspora rosea]
MKLRVCCQSKTHEGLGESNEDVGAIRANYPIPPQCKLFYFEVEIIDEGKNKAIGIGFCEKTVNLNGMPGWYYGSCGYHGDDGCLFCCSGRGNPYGPLFSTGDTIGCCLNFTNNTVFYTKNGVNLDIAFVNLKGSLYPCFGSLSVGGSIEVNFGSRQFKFAATTSNDIGDELLKNKLIEAFNMCINKTNIYTLEDLENSSKIKQDTAALKFRGKFNFIMGIYEDAIIDLTKLIDIEPNNKFALRYRGEAYYLMERYGEAIIDLTKLLNLEPNSKFALRYLGEAYHLTKEVIIDLAKLLDIEPIDDMDESLKKKLIEAFNMCNNVTNIYTLEDLENFLGIKQDTALKFRVKFNFTMERYEDAIVDLTKLIDIDQNNKFALRYRGGAYYLMAKYKEAIIDLTKLLYLEPDSKFALRYLGEAYHLTKKVIIYLAKLLSIEPSDDIDKSWKKN